VSAPVAEPLLEVEGLVVRYRSSAGRRTARSVQAVSGVSFEVRAGETLGLVGESGCGKSTTGKAIVLLERPSEGAVRFEGRDLASLPERELRRVRSRLQMIFQDPRSSLNPRRTVRQLVAEGLEITKVPRPWDERVDAALLTAGLDPEEVADRRAAQLSGGQCQRVAIARALVLNPALVVCDEPVSALDVSVQAQIINVLQDMKAAHRIALLFIAHDLAVVKNVSDRVAVMYLGTIVEIGPVDAVFDRPLHPYTDALLSAVPEPDPHAVDQPLRLSGELPSPLDPPSGCRFRTRCPHAIDRCAEEVPALRDFGAGHRVACHVAGDLVRPSPSPRESEPT
jgi:peptide/nickel transport system ATP-binding protein